MWLADPDEARWKSCSSRDLLRPEPTWAPLDEVKEARPFEKRVSESEVAGACENVAFLKDMVPARTTTGGSRSSFRLMPMIFSLRTLSVLSELRAMRTFGFSSTILLNFSDSRI